jgi:hypothetical protein
MLTDNEGNFSFDGVPVGQVLLVARRPAFSSDDTQEPVTVGASGTNDVTLELTARCSITGDLVLSGDDPPDGVHLQLMQRQIINGRGTWSAAIRSVQVSSDGHFRFGNLAPGTYLVHAAASMDPDSARGSEAGDAMRSGYVPAFYPGARDTSSAAALSLASGQQSQIHFELTREPYYPIVMPVSNPPDSRGVSFQVSSESFLGLPARYSQQDGSVHMQLPNGHYVLRAQGMGPHSLSGEREFDVNATPQINHPLIGPSITLLSVNHVPVVVRTDFTHTTQAPPEDGSVLTALNQVNVELQRESGGQDRNARPSLQNDDNSPASGISQLENVAPGRYWVNARANRGYIASMTSGGVDLLEHPLVVGSDASASPIEITLRDNMASVTATLASSLQSSASTTHRTIYLRLVPRSGSGADRTATFATDGTASLSNLPPGSYYAQASTSRDPIEYRNPRVLFAFAHDSQSITLAPDASTRLTLSTLASTPGGSQ